MLWPIRPACQPRGVELEHMSSVSANKITGRPSRRWDWEKPIVFLGIVVAGMLATLSGLGSESGSKTAVVLPIALGLGLVLAIIGLTRFQVYVMIMLVVRSVPGRIFKRLNL